MQTDWTTPTNSGAPRWPTDTSRNVLNMEVAGGGVEVEMVAGVEVEMVAGVEVEMVGVAGVEVVGVLMSG